MPSSFPDSPNSSNSPNGSNSSDNRATPTQRRFSGLQRLYGVEPAQHIGRAHVVVVGIGGVGSWAAEALARSGIGRLTLVDMDHIAESNINRQIHALGSTLGQAKVLAMQARIADIHPDCQVHVVDDFVTPENWLAIVPPDADAVIDACDQVHAKQAMAHWACSSGWRGSFITIGAAGGKRLAHKVEIDDLAAVTHDPLLAQLRYRLRKHHGAARNGKKIGLHSLFSREAVRGPDASCQLEGEADSSLNCHGYGSVVAVTATFGQCAAGWVLDQLAQKSAKKTVFKKSL